MLDKDLIHHLSELCALDFFDDSMINKDMTDIIRLMDKVKEFSPKTAEKSDKGTDYNSLRQDIILPSSATQEIAADPKISEGNYFVVPKII